MRDIAPEPMFTVHIRFEDGAQPVLYYGMKLTDVLDILKEWCVSWILIPDVGSYLDGIWTFYARPREDNGMSFPEFRKSTEQTRLEWHGDGIAQTRSVEHGDRIALCRSAKKCY